jgi:hypothetical protein
MQMQKPETPHRRTERVQIVRCRPNPFLARLVSVPTLRNFEVYFFFFFFVTSGSVITTKRPISQFNQGQNYVHKFSITSGAASE